MKELLMIMMSVILVDNFVLSKFLGICPFLGVSKKLDSDDVVLFAGTRLGSPEGTEGVTVLRPATSWGPLVSRSTLRLVLHPSGEDRRDGEPGAMEVLLRDRNPMSLGRQ